MDKVMDQTIERKRSTKTKLAAFNQIFQALAQNLQAGLPVTAIENQEEAAKLLQAIFYRFDCSIEVFSYISKATSIIQV